MAHDNARNINNIPLDGDVIGSLQNARVSKLNGTAVKDEKPTELGKLLTYVSANNRWEPSTSSPNSSTDFVNPGDLTYSKIFKVNLLTIDNQTNYSISESDVAIILTGSTVSPTGTITFPSRSTIGRILMFGNVHRSTSFNIKAYAGTTINNTGNTINLIYGGMYICIDGFNWMPIGTNVL